MCVPSLVCQFWSLCFLWFIFELSFDLGFVLYCIFTVVVCFVFLFSLLLMLTFCYFSLPAWRVVFGIFFVKHNINIIYQYVVCLFPKLSFITPVPTPNTGVTVHLSTLLHHCGC